MSFSIQEGRIFGLLGPNGAGKTTTVEIMGGLRKPDSGEISVCGINIQANPEKIKPLIGVQLGQATTIYDRIKVGEAIELFGSYYRNSINTEKFLKMVSLKDKANSSYVTLSGGQKQRMAMALALVNDPRILF
ncbi:MAG: ABC transporter ATP-binding protein [Actinomycetota bacterium]|nr:ABC transporter ATP-binding protein [Actinomycetota bacterium]